MPEETTDGTPIPSETLGGDGSEISLSVLRQGDTSDLDGELGCGFVAEDEQGAYLVMMGVVQGEERNVRRIRIGDYVQPVFSTETGFGSLSDGDTFSTQGMSLTLTTDEQVNDQTEVVAHHATLMVQRMDGAERSYDGIWSCGP